MLVNIEKDEKIAIMDEKDFAVEPAKARSNFNFEDGALVVKYIQNTRLSIIKSNTVIRPFLSITKYLFLNFLNIIEMFHHCEDTVVVAAVVVVVVVSPHGDNSSYIYAATRPRVYDPFPVVRIRSSLLLRFMTVGYISCMRRGEAFTNLTGAEGTEFPIGHFLSR